MLCLKMCLAVLYLYFALCISVDANCDISGSILKKGEIKSVPGKCSQIVCKGTSYDDYEVKTCPNAYAPKNCNFVPPDLSKPYPQCCPHWKC